MTQIEDDVQAWFASWEEALATHDLPAYCRLYDPAAWVVLPVGIVQVGDSPEATFGPFFEQMHNATTEHHIVQIVTSDDVSLVVVFGSFRTSYDFASGMEVPERVSLEGQFCGTYRRHSDASLKLVVDLAAPNLDGIGDGGGASVIVGSPVA